MVVLSTQSTNDIRPNRKRLNKATKSTDEPDDHDDTIVLLSPPAVHPPFRRDQITFISTE